ncbi:MAG: HAD hydrolase-like protein, partial [SAR324 cluster bacterium]|nr:HAD hydrolase-like protein [SAR324 cluster bacterium]
MIIENFRHIVWDFNGTLLDDFDLTVDLVNSELNEHSLPLISPEKYREVFGHPVYKFYERIGFDINRHDFELMSQKFHDDYELRIDECKLHEGVHEILNYCRELGKSQSVLSALPHDILIGLIQKYSLVCYFEHVQGAANSAA